MAVKEVVDVSSELLSNTVLEVGRVASWLQALGIIILISIIFQTINFILNRKRIKILREIQNRISKIERKLKSPKK